ncbi:MAG TPA: hypothetical protein DEO59_17440 [Balneola sp.]|nr:hypothetical protein [Balneola sp.]MBF64186.1 hypothetical protein [Balneola sp.]HAW78350.1 hypothetical protein [Balneola sp.]HBZ40166.1 hypothetical protein [Balneola sp.]|tara:strand:- start:358 stop:1449 length:1092 start_codon:yes stop_codon:yes gene_type:complete
MTSLKYPSLILDETIAKNNIKKMATKASKLGVKFRPHFKTHQSLEIGNWFRGYPLDGITVSSLKMAQFFAKNGWKSITIAFPVNILQLEEIDKLASEIDLRVLVVDEETVKQLDKKLTSNLNVYIEIDPGYGRSGISYSDPGNIQRLVSVINSSYKLTLSGLYSHAGHSYRSRSVKDIRQLSSSVIEKLSQLKTQFEIPVCFGDTPSCSVLDDFGLIDEISPGNFVFYDWIQTKIGSCTPKDIAVAMKCTVVAKYSSRHELLIHGGAVHFSKDADITKDGESYFGQVVKNRSNYWEDPIEGCYLKSISQEHGIVKCTENFFYEISIGDAITILPIHSCLTADLMGSYYTTTGRKISHLSEKII